ncbi:MAG: polyphosphate polymerase domain-containing protein [Lachnospiraceae bacterium]|nr:polyphosphate polymerase domain-containing protein [Lachnospiraceae bacterium]
MQQYNMIFKRNEQKYLLTEEQYHALWELISSYLEEDEYGQSTICNLYYDTADYELIRTSMEKPIYKEKLRLRSYGVPKEDTTVFVEIKKKYDGIVYKRRIGLPLMEAMRGLEQGHIEPVPGQEQISAEINYFLQRYSSSLMPAVFLAYDRSAFRGMDDGELRVTFDFNIRSRQEHLSLSDGAEGELFFQNGEVMLEIKTIGAYPFWLVRALEACQVYPASFSKYGNIYRSHIFPNFIKDHGILLG